jgi:VCBS repeat-containing protein
MHQILRKALVVSLAAALGVGVVAAVAFAGPGNSPAVTFASSSPGEGATLTSDSAMFAFSYNRTTTQTRSLVCSLSGPSTSLSAPCDHLVNIKGGAQADKSYSGLANGSYTFTANLTDGGTASATRHFTVAANHAPVARNDAYATNEDTPLTITPGVLANDSDADGNPLTALLLTAPSHGTLGFSSDGSFVYTPNANYNGSDSFTYKASDGSANSNVATVSITVNPVDDAPMALNDSVSTGENAPPVHVDVLANDTDSDGGPKTIASASDPAHGTVVLTGGSTGASTGLTYQPVADYCGPDTFTYTLNGGSTATVSISVKCPANSLRLSPGEFEKTDSTSGEDHYLYSFGSAFSASQTFTVTNEGTEATDPLNVTVFGAHFLALTSNTCTSGLVLAAGGTCSFTFTWGPLDPTCSGKFAFTDTVQIDGHTVATPTDPDLELIVGGIC